MSYKPSYSTALNKALQRAGRDTTLLDGFLRALLTPSEYKELAIRWQIVSLLEQGMPQREIATKLGVGIATVTRGARELQRPHSAFTKLWRLTRTKKQR
jgi:TrpR family trp operon transcriptional repressor